MTDLTTAAPITRPTISLPRLGNPLPAIGRAFVTSLKVCGQAVALAYVAPWTASTKRQGPVFDDALNGRDPNW